MARDGADRRLSEGGRLTTAAMGSLCRILSRFFFRPIDPNDAIKALTIRHAGAT
jgi:hypothetical protein